MSKFWDNIKRMSKEFDEQCKRDPRLRAERELSRRRTRCAATHKDWRQDWDVHGALEQYCGRCGVWRGHYSFGYRNRESTMTCDQIYKEKYGLNW